MIKAWIFMHKFAPFKFRIPFDNTEGIIISMTYFFQLALLQAPYWGPREANPSGVSKKASSKREKLLPFSLDRWQLYSHPRVSSPLSANQAFSPGE